MPRTTLAGHPLHPQLVELPAALLPVSLVLDLMHLRTGKRSYADAAYYTMMGGYIGGLGAAAAGAGDYFGIPSSSQTKKVANLHASLNLAVMALYSLNLLRRRARPELDALSLAMSAAGTAGIAVSAWYGAQMVYEHGMRVRGRSEVADVPELKLPGDEQLEELFIKVEETVAGPGGDGRQLEPRG